MAEPGSRRREHDPAQLTARDLELLAFVAGHRLVLTSQVAALLGSSPGAAAARLGALARSGYVRYRPIFYRQPSCCQITRKGLAAIGSDLPSPRLNLAEYRHDVGLAWLWIAASSGAIGPLREVLGERELRSRDGASRRPRGPRAPVDPGREPLAVRLGGYGPRGQERLHYPDLLVVMPGGRRVAFELELSPKDHARRERILAGYASDSRIDAVIYLVENRPPGPAIGRAIEKTARGLGIASLVHVRSWRSAAPAAGTGRPIGIEHGRPRAGPASGPGRALSSGRARDREATR